MFIMFKKRHPVLYIVQFAVLVVATQATTTVFENEITTESELLTSERQDTSYDFSAISDVTIETTTTNPVTSNNETTHYDSTQAATTSYLAVSTTGVTSTVTTPMGSSTGAEKKTTETVKTDVEFATTKTTDVTTKADTTTQHDDVTTKADPTSQPDDVTTKVDTTSQSNDVSTATLTDIPICETNITFTIFWKRLGCPNPRKQHYQQNQDNTPSPVRLGSISEDTRSFSPNTEARQSGTYAHLEMDAVQQRTDQDERVQSGVYTGLVPKTAQYENYMFPHPRGNAN